MKIFHKFAEKSQMKNIFFLTSLVLSLSVFSQEEEIKPLPKEVKDKLIIDLTLDSWKSAPPGIHLQTWSPGASVALFNDIRFGRSPFGFAFGIGVSSHNVHHNGTFTEAPATDTTPAFTSFVPRMVPFKKNKLVTNYIEIPFELRFRTSGENPFRFYPGFKFGYRVNIHTKVIDDTGKWKFYTFPNVDPLRYGATARIGYGIFNFHGFYGLNSLFRKNQGPELIPWSAGISWIL